MNWLQKISQKYMPLPTNTLRQQEDREDGAAGIYRTDEMMTQETADMLRQQYPEIDYGGAGAIGIAFQTGPNEILKVTRDWREADIAKTVFKQPLDWVVPILAEPEMVQEDPPLWGIRMKKLQPIVDTGLALMISDLTIRSSRNGFPNPNQARVLINDVRGYDLADQEETAMQLYAQIKRIMELNEKSLWLPDIHGGNVGWDDDGRLKVFDLGPGNMN